MYLATDVEIQPVPTRRVKPEDVDAKRGATREIKTRYTKTRRLPRTRHRITRHMEEGPRPIRSNPRHYHDTRSAIEASRITTSRPSPSYFRFP